MSRAYPTKNEARAYGDGYAQGGEDSRILAQHEARALAFGAIRRAVEIAHRYDRAELEMANGNLWEAAGVYGRYADNIRRAIRAAIGSDKA